MKAYKSDGQAQGLWMGRPVPLGYAVQDRRLVVVEPDAELVRHTMRRYLALSSVRELAAQGHWINRQHNASGPHCGVAYAHGTLFQPLGNRIYLGEIVHKDNAYPGEHTTIVDYALWHAVQTAMRERTSRPLCTQRSSYSPLPLGLLVDWLDRPMTYPCREV